MSQDDKEIIQDKSYKIALRKIEILENKRYEETSSITEDHQKKRVLDKLDNFLNCTQNILKENITQNEKSEKIRKLEESLSEGIENTKEIEKFTEDEVIKYYSQKSEIISHYKSTEKFIIKKVVEEIDSTVNLEEQHNRIEKIYHTHSEPEKIYLHYLKIEEIISRLSEDPTLLEGSTIFKSLLGKVNENNIKNISNRIIQDLIYPELNKPVQPNTNILLKALKNLENSKTTEDINQILKALVSEYKVLFIIKHLNSEAKEKFSDFLKKAQTYKLKLPAPSSSPNDSKKSMQSRPPKR